MFVVLRRHVPLPLDDCLYVLQPSISASPTAGVPVTGVPVRLAAHAGERHSTIEARHAG